MYTGKLYEYEGKLLPVKTIAGLVQLAPSTLYKYLNQGFSLYDAIAEGKKKSKVVFKNREKTNNRVAKKYLYQGKMLTVIEVSDLEEISSESLYRRLNKGMSIDEAVQSIKNNISKKYSFRGQKISVYKMSLLTGVPKYYLMQNIDLDKEYTEEELERIISSYKKNILMVGDITLFQYCIKNQLNYNVIFYNIKKRGLSIEDAIFDYVNSGQRDYFSYSYTLGNVLLFHFFIKERLNDRYIQDRMQKGDSVEKAIVACIFLEGENYANRNIRNELFSKYWNLGLERFLKENYSAEDKKFVTTKHFLSEAVLKKYHLYQAYSLLSLEVSSEDRKELLNRLNLTEQDLIDCADDMFEGFVERTPSTKEIEPLFYTWRGIHKK